MRVAFAGGDRFAVPTLTQLANAPNVQLACVMAIPDKAAGRGLQTSPGPIPLACLELGLPCHQPDSDAQLQRLLLDTATDFLITCAYGRKLGPATLATPTKACINIHASLLPRWRGATPIEHALLAGDEVTGITTMLMAERIDAGAILLQRELMIANNATSGQLREQLAITGGKLILETLRCFDQLEPHTQNPGQVTQAPRIEKRKAKLDWTLSAVELHRRIRAFNPAPGAFTLIGGKRIKIHAAIVQEQNGIPGTVLGVVPEGISVACGEGSLLPTVVQPAGGKAMSAAAWLRGRPQKIAPGMLLLEN